MCSIDRASLNYQAFYCEENIWRLLGRAQFQGRRSWAVIVSNQAREVILLRQLAGRPIDGLIHWDYHVFAVLEEGAAQRLALDPDSDLPFPCPLDRYLEESFPADVQKRNDPVFRLIPGDEYCAQLSSDRSHMRRPDGSWLAPPPSWPAPGSKEGRPGDFIAWTDVRERRPGTLYDRDRMVAFAAGS